MVILRDRKFFRAASSKQSQAAPAKEIRPQSFFLINDKNIPAGVFGFDKDGNPSITLFDKAGISPSRREAGAL